MCSPSISIDPSSILSSPFKVRSKVLLPEPLRPMIATTCPDSTEKSMPFRTWFAPNCFFKFWVSTSGIPFPFERARVTGKRITNHEIDHGDKTIDYERPECRVRDHRSGFGEFGEADDRDQRRVLHGLHAEADRRAYSDARGLRKNHVTQLLEVIHREAGRGFPLTLGNCFNAAAPDLGEIRAGEQREADGCSNPRLNFDAEQGQTEEHKEQLHQKRRALEDLNVDLHDSPQHTRTGHAHHEQYEAHDAAGHERNDRQHDGPAGRKQQIGEYLLEGKFDHRAPRRLRANRRLPDSLSRKRKRIAITR